MVDSTTTSLDFSLLKKDPAYVLANVQQTLQALTNNNWTDYSPADPGWITVLAQIGLATNDSMFTDAMGNECFLATAKLRESVVRRAKERGYQIGMATPATCSMQINCPAFNSQLIIPANTQWLVNGVTFTCLNQIVIPAGQTSFVVTLTQGTPYSLTVNAPGTAWFPISLPPNLANIVVAVNGVVWTPIDSWIDPPVQTAYLLYEDVSGYTVRFGNNISTSRPNLNDVITITAVTTLGADGNNEANNLTASLITVVRDSSNNNITNSITGKTLTAALGGIDIESTASIRANAPADNSAQDRAVTVDDYIYWAGKVSGVTSCTAIGGENIGRYSEVWVYIFGEDPYNVPPDLLTYAQTFLETLAVGTVTPVLKAPNIIEMYQNLLIGVDNSYSDAETQSIVAQTSMADYVASLGIGGGKKTHGYRQSLAEGAVTNNVGIEYATSSFTLRASALSSANKITISLPSGIDLTSAQLLDANGNSLLKNSAGATVASMDLTSYVTANSVLTTNPGVTVVTGNTFLMVIPNLTNQVVTLIFKSTTDDVILAYNQILVLKNLTITTELN